MFLANKCIDCFDILFKTASLLTDCHTFHLQFGLRIERICYFFSEKERANITQWLDSNAFELTRKMELKRLICLLKGMKEIEMFVLISVLVRLAWFQDLPRREYHLCAHPSREGNVTKHAPRWLWLHSRVCLAYQQASRARVLHNHKQDARVFEILEEQHNVITGIKTHPGFLRGLKKKSRKESA